MRERGSEGGMMGSIGRGAGGVVSDFQQPVLRFVKHSFKKRPTQRAQPGNLIRYLFSCGFGFCLM